MLTLTDLFSLDHTQHPDLFDGVTEPWGVLPLIAEYLDYHLDGPKLLSSTSRAAAISGIVSIGEGTIIHPGVVIEGPVIIGRNCELRPGSYLRGNVIIGDNCIIGNSTELKNVLLFDGVTLPHFNYVGDSVLGYKAHLGGGVIVSNYKLGGSSIKVSTLEGTIDTGLEKFGALIGDNVEIGANSVLNPGTIIGRDSVIYPLASIRGIINPGMIVKLRQQHEIVQKKG